MAKAGRTSGTEQPNRRLTRHGGKVADWGHVDAEIIRACIVAASNAGGCVRFGTTSDGGAYSIGIYGDTEKPYTEYVPPGDDIEAFLRDVESMYLDIEVANRPKLK